MKKLSIIIPVYNEERTVCELLKKVLSIKFPVKAVEYLVIDDGSTDNSKITIQKLQYKGIKLLVHKKNQGKGAAVRTGLKHATGDYIIIQDADLEYNPADIIQLLSKLEKNKKQVVYGTRLKRLPNFKRDERTPVFLIHYFGNKFLSFATSILYFHWVTDMECCYKLVPREALKDMQLHARGFEFEPEITAKLLKRGYKIAEVSITTQPRGYNEGKKLYAVKDGTKALWTLLKYRFVE
ncbi:MAG TPA: glycosyltransferase family 2 protein [Candidatus Sulfotelmatobacter sp.]|jgi:dolichol-phosphate mannosyltransferase|nr:glycosyltransferase family 2 protein [Candidatus Sulfotelmatobacter sp.]